MEVVRPPHGLAGDTSDDGIELAMDMAMALLLVEGDGEGHDMEMELNGLQ